MFDVLITNARVLDGSGKQAFAADIGITGDKITDVGDLKQSEAKNVIDAGGNYVCPGFIDAHSHSDAYILAEPSSPSKTFQGITTEIVGNCGASAAPLTGDYKMPSDWRNKEYPGTWSTVAEYRALLEQVQPSPNIMLLIGHNALRAGIAGYTNRELTDDEMKSMTIRLEEALSQGGRGLSTGLIYPPGMSAPREELVELAKIAAKHDGIYTSHMRSEGESLIEAIQEAIDIGANSGVRVQISHLKATGEDNWHLAEKAISTIRQARENGLDIAADRYPYTMGNTELDVVFPDWMSEGGNEAAMARLQDKTERKRLREHLTKSISDKQWSTITIGSTSHPDNRQFQGMTLTNVAKALDVQPVDAVIHLTESDELKTSAFFGGMSEQNMFSILAEPYVMIGSDASLRSPEGQFSHDFPHPRAYGSFPRFLRMSLDGKTVELPEAIRKITSLPAAQFRMNDRGIIEKGKKADIVIFNPDKLHDTSTYSQPHKLAQGVDYVIVNGIITLQNKSLTGDRAGRFL